MLYVYIKIYNIYIYTYNIKDLWEALYNFS